MQSVSGCGTVKVFLRSQDVRYRERFTGGIEPILDKTAGRYTVGCSLEEMRGLLLSWVPVKT